MDKRYLKVVGSLFIAIFISLAANAAAPTAPLNVFACQATTTSATVFFTAPIKTNGTILNYTATITTISGTTPLTTQMTTTNGSTYSLTFTGLTTGSTYSFTVTTTNGTVSPASLPSNNLTLITLSAINIFNGSTNNDWNTTTNWSLGTIPTATTPVAIASGVTANISNNQSAFANTITLGVGSTLINSSGSCLTISTQSVNKVGITIDSAILDNEGVLNLTSLGGNCFSFSRNNNIFTTNGTCNLATSFNNYVFNLTSNSLATISGIGFTMGTTSIGIPFGLANIGGNATIIIDKNTTVIDYPAFATPSSFNNINLTGINATCTNNGILTINSAANDYATSSFYAFGFNGGTSSGLTFNNNGTFNASNNYAIINVGGSGTCTINNNTNAVMNFSGSGIAIQGKSGNLSINNLSGSILNTSTTNFLKLATTVGFNQTFTNTGIINITKGTSSCTYAKGANPGNIYNNTNGVINFNYNSNTTPISYKSGSSLLVLNNNGGVIRGYNCSFAANTFISGDGTLSPQPFTSTYSGIDTIGSITLPANYQLTGTLTAKIKSNSSFGQLICPSLDVTAASLQTDTFGFSSPSQGLNIPIAICFPTLKSPFSSFQTLGTGFRVNYSNPNFIYLNYDVLPTPPTGISAYGGNQQVSVAFTPSENSLGSTFIVTPYMDTTALPTDTGFSSPIIVKGLINGTTYTFTVTAINSVGSAVSLASNPVVPMPTIASIDTLTAHINADTKTNAATNTNINRYIGSLWVDSSGTWNDINYTAVFPNANANNINHFSRIQSLAIAYSTPSVYYHSFSVMNVIQKALKYFVNNKSVMMTNAGGWGANIGDPQYLTASLLLLKDAIDATIKSNVMVYIDSLGKAKLSYNTGQNLAWVSQWKLSAGCLNQDSAFIAKAVSNAATVLNITSGTVDGLKVDNAYFQHNMNYNGGYGADLIPTLLNFPAFVKNTSFDRSFPISTLGNYILNGQYWFQFHTRGDFVPKGRQIARSFDPYYFTDSFSLKTMMSLDPTRSSQYQAYINHQHYGANFTQSGTKHFFTSDLMVHRDSITYMSVKIPSTRNVMFEVGNYENLKGYNEAYGFTQILTHDTDFSQIEPIWDWSRLPGTTTPMGILDSNKSAQTTGAFYRPYGLNTLAGGVCDGINGVMAYSGIDSNGVTATKSYFFLGNEMVCLGTGISFKKPNNTNFRKFTDNIVTSVNQTITNGVVTMNNSGTQAIFSGKPTTYSNTLNWVQHNNIGYYFPNQTANIIIDTATQSGNTFSLDIPYGKKTTVSKNVFSVWFDHGTNPTAGSYEYIVVPSVSATSFPVWVANNPYTILSNTSTLQCVKNANKNLYGIAFYQAGSITLDNGMIVTVDKPAIIILDGIFAKGDSLKLRVADPLYVSGNTITVTLTQALTKNIICTMPTGNYLGSSYSTSFMADALLPIQLTSFTANKQGSSVQLNWVTTAETNNKGFAIEKKADENDSWHELGFVDGKGIVSSYHFTDNQPLEGHNNYRLRLIETDGSTTYSQVATVNFEVNSKPSFQIFPNPMIGNLLNINIENLTAGKYSVFIYNNLGQRITTEIINHLGGNTLHKIPLKGIQTKEVYHVVIRDESGGLRLDKLLMRAM